MTQYLSRCRLTRPDGQYWEVYVVCSANDLVELSARMAIVTDAWMMLKWGFRTLSTEEWYGKYPSIQRPHWDMLSITMGGEWHFPEGYDLEAAFLKFLGWK